MERNAQHMAQGAESADNTIIGSKRAEINKHMIDNPDHHLSSNLKAEDHNIRQRRARYIQLMKHTLILRSCYLRPSMLTDLTLRTLRFDDYRLQATVGRVFFVAWATGPSTQQMVLKYKVKIADY